MTHADRQRRYRERHPEYIERELVRARARWHNLSWDERQADLLRNRHRRVQRRIEQRG